MHVLEWIGIGLLATIAIGFIGIAIAAFLADPTWPLTVIYTIIYCMCG